MESGGFKPFDLVSTDVGWKVHSSGSVVTSPRRSKSRLSAHRERGPSSKPTAEGGYCDLDSKSDCCAFVIHCCKHNRVVLTSTAKAHYSWLPFTPLPANKSWYDGSLAGSFIVLSGGEQSLFMALKNNPPYLEIQCMNVLRLQLPQTQRFVTRLVYYVKLDPNTENKSFKCCTNTTRLEWVSIGDVLGGKLKNLWGPEVVKFCQDISSSIYNHVVEYSLEEAFTYVPRDPPRNEQEDVLKSIKITEKDVERLYDDFLEHCFPSFYQLIDSFKFYIKQHGIELDDARLSRLFNAFNHSLSGYLSFHEFLIGLALLEPKCIHKRLRAEFIFRYYDQNRDGYLDKEELHQMVNDIWNLSGENNDTTQRSFQEATRELEIKTVQGKEVISMDAFCTAVGLHKFRGTSILCRSSKPIFTQISRAIAQRTLKTTPITKLSAVVLNRSYKGTCHSCKAKKYELATHCAQIGSQGYFVKAHQVLSKNEGSANQTRSLEIVFNSKCVANLLIGLIKEFNNHKGDTANPNGLLAAHPDQLLEMVQKLYQEVSPLLKMETKCKKVLSPCYIIGDIHGNLEDLLSLEKTIWRRIPCVSAHYLFLGDYVDRGRWSLECALYLIAFKVIAPDNVTLLRGNHEVRSLQEQYTYKKECLLKLGKDYGSKIWELTNRIFDLLPVCAVVDDRIFCAHGGIPRSTFSVEEITKIPQNIRDPQRESAVIWEMLWSDPCHMQQFNEIAELCSRTANDDVEHGYVVNPKRGTAFMFSEIAAKGFFSKNGLTHIVRAHEPPPLGYTFHFGNKCTTIFSCSHYCGNNNDCACILVDNQTLRVIHLDTVNNASATD